MPTWLQCLTLVIASLGLVLSIINTAMTYLRGRVEFKVEGLVREQEGFPVAYVRVTNTGRVAING